MTSEDPLRQRQIAAQMRQFFVDEGHTTVTENDCVEMIRVFTGNGLMSLGPEKPSQADELWEALELEENHQVTDAVIIAKVAHFDTGGTALSLAATDGVDWISQFGMLHGAVAIMNQEKFTRGAD
jgi:hypothetical protein